MGQHHPQPRQSVGERPHSSTGNSCNFPIFAPAATFPSSSPHVSPRHSPGQIAPAPPPASSSATNSAAPDFSLDDDFLRHIDARAIREFLTNFNRLSHMLDSESARLAVAKALSVDGQIPAPPALPAASDERAANPALLSVSHAMSTSLPIVRNGVLSPSRAYSPSLTGHTAPSASLDDAATAPSSTAAVSATAAPHPVTPTHVHTHSSTQSFYASMFGSISSSNLFQQRSHADSQLNINTQHNYPYYSQFPTSQSSPYLVQGSPGIVVPDFIAATGRTTSGSFMSDAGLPPPSPAHFSLPSSSLLSASPTPMLPQSAMLSPTGGVVCPKCRQRKVKEKELLQKISNLEAERAALWRIIQTHHMEVQVPRPANLTDLPINNANANDTKGTATQANAVNSAVSNAASHTPAHAFDFDKEKDKDKGKEKEKETSEQSIVTSSSKLETEVSSVRSTSRYSITAASASSSSSSSAASSASTSRTPTRRTRVLRSKRTTRTASAEIQSFEREMLRDMGLARLHGLQGKPVAKAAVDHLNLSVHAITAGKRRSQILASHGAYIQANQKSVEAVAGPELCTVPASSSTATGIPPLPPSSAASAIGRGSASPPLPSGVVDSGSASSDKSLEEKKSKAVYHRPVFQVDAEQEDGEDEDSTSQVKSPNAEEMLSSIDEDESKPEKDMKISVSSSQECNAVTTDSDKKKAMPEEAEKRVAPPLKSLSVKENGVVTFKDSYKEKGNGAILQNAVSTSSSTKHMSSSSTSSNSILSSMTSAASPASGSASAALPTVSTPSPSGGSSLSAMSAPKVGVRLLRADGNDCLYEFIDDGLIDYATKSTNLVRLVWAHPPKTVLIIKKPRDPSTARALYYLAKWMTQQGIQVVVEPDVYKEEECGISQLTFLRTWSSEAEQRQLHRYIDFIVCLGGDGTLLWVCNLFRTSIPPILSFAMGSLGFLSPFPMETFKDAIKKVIEGGFYLTLRSRLVCTVIRAGNKKANSAPPSASHSPSEAAATNQSSPAEKANGSSGMSSGSGLPDGEIMSETYVCLNEVIVDRGVSSYLTNLDCFVDGMFFTKVQADGIIVATPTGSTAYSLSAGGSMVHPEVPTIAFTPVCPHSLSFRPLLFPDSSTLQIQVSQDSRGGCSVSFDGRNRTTLERGDCLLVSMSRWPMPTICRKDETTDWFDGVRGILKWNTRSAQKNLFLDNKAVQQMGIEELSQFALFNEPH